MRQDNGAVRRGSPEGLAGGDKAARRWWGWLSREQRGDEANHGGVRQGVGAPSGGAGLDHRIMPAT